MGLSSVGKQKISSEIGRSFFTLLTFLLSIFGRLCHSSSRSRRESSAALIPNQPARNTRRRTAVRVSDNVLPPARAKREIAGQHWQKPTSLASRPRLFPADGG